MALTRRQQQIANEIKRIGRHRRERPKRIVAALETGRVETNFGP